MWPFRQKVLHEPGNRLCKACSDGWPRKHEICGGLFHGKSNPTSKANVLRGVRCDKCGQQMVIETIGFDGPLPAEAVKQGEQAVFDDVLAKASDSRRIHVDERATKDPIFLKNEAREMPTQNDPQAAPFEETLTIAVPQGTERGNPTLDDEGSIFAGKNVAYAIEKILDYCYHPSVAGTQHFADFGVKQILAGLQELEAKMRQACINVDNSNFPTALRSVSELQQYIDKQPSSITDEIEARIYVQSLEKDLEELRRWERDLDEERPAS